MRPSFIGHREGSMLSQHHSYTLRRRKLLYGKIYSCVYGGSNVPGRLVSLQLVTCGASSSQQEFAAPTNARFSALDWLEVSGMVEEGKLHIKSDPFHGQAVLKKKVSEGETVASIPETAWLTKEVAQKHPEIGSYVGDLEPWIALSIFLLHESEKQSTEWARYVESLKRNPPQSPLLWSESELEMLEGCQILDSVKSYKAFFRSKFDELHDDIFSKHPEVFIQSVFNQQGFVWAATCVRALTHPPLDKENIALVAGIESVGHARMPRVSLEVQAGGLFGGKASLALRAAKALGEGDAITFDYAPGYTEGHVLLNHGKVDPKAPGTFALTLVLPEDDKFFDDKVDILEQNGLFSTSEFLLQTGSPPDDAMIAMLRLINLEGPDAFLLESIFRNEVWEHLNLPVSEPNERAVCESMVSGCEAVLMSYPTKIEEDIEALRVVDDPLSHEGMAILIRMREKEVLEAAMRYFANVIDKLESLEYYSERRLKRLGLLDKEGKPTDWDSFFEDGIA